MTLGVVIGTNPPIVATTIASGSNGAVLPLVAPNNVINVASTAGFPSAGQLIIAVAASVANPAGLVGVSYTGLAGGNQFTGVTGSGPAAAPGTLVTGNAVTLASEQVAQGGQQPSAPVINIGFDVQADASYPAGGYAFDAGAALTNATYMTAQEQPSIPPPAGYAAQGNAYPSVFAPPFSAVYPSTNYAYSKAPFNIIVLSEKYIDGSANVWEWAYDRVNLTLRLLKNGAEVSTSSDNHTIRAIRVLVLSR